MFTKISFAAFVAAAIASAPVLAARNNGTEATVASKTENVIAQEWCAGPRQYTDFRCFKS